MAFSSLAGIGVLLLVAILILAGMAPVILIPVLLVVVGAGVAIWLVGTWLRGARVTSGPGESGVPGTSDASYDPRVRH